MSDYNLFVYSSELPEIQTARGSKSRLCVQRAVLRSVPAASRESAREKQLCVLHVLQGGQATGTHIRTVPQRSKTKPLVQVFNMLHKKIQGLRIKSRQTIFSLIFK